MNKITAQQIELAITRKFDARQNLFVPNVSWGLWLHECDLLMMSKAGYLTEFEIKISASDLKKDKIKRHGHNSDRVKSLYFVFPQKLLKYEKEVPERAGIIVYEYRRGRDRCRVYRRAQINKLAQPLSIEDRYQLARLGSLRIWNLKYKIDNQKSYIKGINFKLKQAGLI